MATHNFNQSFTGTYSGGNTDCLEQRFIPIRDESNKDFPNFDIDKTYPGEWKISENFIGFDNVASLISKNLDTYKATLEVVNDYEIICKSENSYIQMSIRNIDSDLYCMLVGSIRHWLDQLLNAHKDSKRGNENETENK